MNTYFKAIRKPLKWVPFPKGMYFIGLFLEGMMFPLEQISVGLIQKYLVNAVEYGELRYMKYVYALSAVILVTVFVFNPLANCLKECAMQDYSRNLGELAAARLLDYRYSVYEGYGTGELITRLRDNLGAIPHIYTESIFRLLLGIFYGGGAVAVMLTFSWQLSIAVILLCVLESFLIKKGAEKITKKEEALQKLTDRQYQLLIEMVKNLDFIRIASVSDRMRRRYRKASEEGAQKALEIGRVHVVLSLVEDGFEALNLALIFSLGICLYLSDGIDLGSVLSFLYLQDGISYMINNLREFFAGINSQKVCCSRVEELLNQEQEGVILSTKGEVWEREKVIQAANGKSQKRKEMIQTAKAGAQKQERIIAATEIEAQKQETQKKKRKTPEHKSQIRKQEKEISEGKSGLQERKESTPKDALAGDIMVDNLSFQYSSGEKQVFDSLHLTIPKGKITLLSGVSGSGKSTLLKLLLALYSPKSGSIRIGERDYQKMEYAEIRSCYAYVEQFPYLFHDTIEANIRCGNSTASFAEVMEAAKLAKAHDFIMQKEHGYQTVVQEQGNNFSGGEKQRIAIARALLKNAPVLILDEASSAIDQQTEAEISKNFRKLADQGKTILVVSHRKNPSLQADFEIVHEHP